MIRIRRILLADDHSFIRLGLVQLLHDEFPMVEIRQVADGESLVKEVMQGGWDLVISDLDMPGRSGLEALEQIKLIKPDLPVLILSIYPEELYAIRVLKAGASGYMNKNSAPEELITAINKIAMGKRYITPEIAERLMDNETIAKQPHELLSNRELEIFKLLALGKTISQIADTLSLALTTVSTHRGRIMNKLGLTTNSELTRYAMSHRIINEFNK